MEERARTIRRMFSSISPRYDFLNHLLSASIDRRWRKHLAAKLIDANTHRLLDLCTGTGDVAFALSACMTQGAVFGADFSREMLQIGARKAEQRTATASVNFIESDALHLPFSSAYFDAVSIAFGLRNIVDWKAGLREMARVTRPGGKVAILEFSLPQHQPLRGLYLAYFTRFLPWIGNQFSRTKAYSYLTDTVLEWPSPDNLAREMEHSGLSEVTFERLSGGIACIHIGRKND